MAGRSWTHKVVKRMRGHRGEYFDYPTAKTFSSEAEARSYAEAFARKQGSVPIYGARIVVKTRGGSTVAVYKSDDYIGTRDASRDRDRGWFRQPRLHRRAAKLGVARRRRGSRRRSR